MAGKKGDVFFSGTSWLSIVPSFAKFDRCRNVSQREVAGRIDDEFCGSSINVGVGGRYPLAAESSAVLDTLSGHEPTSLGVVVYNNATTLLVCTAAGQLLKVSFFSAKP